MILDMEVMAEWLSIFQRSSYDLLAYILGSLMLRGWCDGVHTHKKVETYRFAAYYICQSRNILQPLML